MFNYFHLAYIVAKSEQEYIFDLLPGDILVIVLDDSSSIKLTRKGNYSLSQSINSFSGSNPMIIQTTEKYSIFDAVLAETTQWWYLIANPFNVTLTNQLFQIKAYRKCYMIN